MNLSNFRELTTLAAIVADFRDSVNNVTPLIVGATARDLLLHYDLGVPLTRRTHDIDLAFAVSDWKEFDYTRESLIHSGYFEPKQNRVHRLVHQCGLPVDLVPFGGVENSNQQIEWPRENTVMNVLGYREAEAGAIDVILPENQSVLVISLPMLALLKLYTWSDRHVVTPRKDAEDLFLILVSYLSGDNADRLYSDASHLLETEDFDFERAGAWLLGYDIAVTVFKTSKNSESLIEAARSILEVEIDPDGRLNLLGESVLDAERCLKLLTGFYDGLMSIDNSGHKK